MKYLFLLSMIFSNVSATYNPQTNTYTVDSSGLVRYPGPSSDHTQKEQNKPQCKKEKTHGKR